MPTFRNESSPIRSRWILIAAAAASALASARPARAADPKPATVAEAMRILDLATFPVPPGVEKPGQRNLASLFYEAEATVKAAFDFQRKNLLERKWKELPGGYASDESTNGAFERDGFRLSVSVFTGSKPGTARVSLTNHGNVDPAKLPLPPGTKPFYATAVSAAFLADAPVDKTAEACRKLLVAQGWEPYGTAGDSQFFKQNAVRLNAFIAAAPAQMGKTAITYSTEQLSADLPLPAETVSAQYSDSTKQLLFDTKSPLDEVMKFYRETLGKAGWKPIGDSLIKLDFKQGMYWFNPQKDRILVETYPVDEILRVVVTHHSAAELAEIDRLIKEELERKKNQKSKPLPKVAITLPEGAKEIEQPAKSKLEFKLATGKAQAAAEALRKQLGKEGWKEKDSDLNGMFGTLTFGREGQELSITYVDPGLIPAEFTISGSGIELERTGK